MSLPPSNIFAVLIGIDKYYDQYKPKGDPRSSDLNGCVNDVSIVNTFLTTTLKVPVSNIHTLTSPHGPRPETLPTKTNVVALIQEVARKAVEHGPGSLFFMHYSGHGSRTPTIYDKAENGALKSAGSYDEGLCTLGDPDSDSLGDPVLDVEMSGILDGLHEQGLTVFLSLDCCHSGGADRDAQYPGAGDTDGDTGPEDGLGKIFGVRCPPSYFKSDDDVQFAGRGDGGGRNVLVQESWLYRNRNHNLLAACQPSELAMEAGDDSGRPCGKMTYYLSKTLKELEKSETPITYEILITHLVSKSGIGDRIYPQQPMLLGNRNRLLFGTNTQSVLTGAMQGSVTGSKAQPGFTLITINKGYAHGVEVGDRFALYKPDQFAFGLLKPGEENAGEVTIDEAFNLTATAKVPTGSEIANIPGTGWFVLPIQAKNHSIVYFNRANLSSDFVAGLEKAWEDLPKKTFGRTADLIFRDGLNVSPNDAVDTFHVETSEDGTSLVVRDSKGAVMDNIPSLKLGDADFAEKLSRLVQHLSSYQRLANLVPRPDRSSWNPKYEFNVTRVHEDVNDSAEVPYRISFKNTEPVPIRNNRVMEEAKTQFITIFNLDPTYGVSLISPREGEDSVEIYPGESMEPIDISTQAPDTLKDASKQPGFKMRDQIKVLITSKATNFRHYIQPDLESWANPDLPEEELIEEITPEGQDNNGRQVRRRSPKPQYRTLDEFCVESRDIITTHEDLYGNPNNTTNGTVEATSDGNEGQD